MSSIKIRPLKNCDLKSFISFTDEQAGQGYFDQNQALKCFELALSCEKTPSFVLVHPDSSELLGLRLSFPPGPWLESMSKKCLPHLWKTDPKAVGYFKSLFVHPKLQGQGWGPKLSQKSIETLKELETQAVVCHSWKESPHNSSMRYLQKYGFQVIGEHPLFWKDINYQCNRCGSPPCQCTGTEMIYYLDPSVDKN